MKQQTERDALSAVNVDIAKERDTLRAELDALRSAMLEFVDRCYAGEVRSKATYWKFKELLVAPVAPAQQDVNAELVEALESYVDFAAQRRSYLGFLSEDMEAVDRNARTALANAKAAPVRPPFNGVEAA